MDKEDKKVSVIVPYYNTMEFFQECIDSILDQTYSNLEIIIINDGSDEKNTDFLENLLTDERIVYIKNPQKYGVAFCRNKGISVATGDFILFVDSDDFLDKNAIKLLVNKIGDYPLIKGSTLKLKRPKDLKKAKKNNGKKTVKLKRSEKIFTVPTVLNILFRRDFIFANSITFSSCTEIFTDLSAILPIIELDKSYPVIKNYTYFKRVRNDPISNPSLNQKPIEKKFLDLIIMIQNLKKKFGDSITNRYLDNYFIKYVSSPYSVMFTQFRK